MSRIYSSMVYIVLILLIGEGLMRFVNPLVSIPHGYICRGVGNKDILELRKTFIKDKYLFWKLDPNIKGNNSMGFRDREFTVKKREDTVRIICMGDAITFGWPVRIENTYPKVLENMLSTQFPHYKFEVFNAGVPGYTSYQGLMWFKRTIINCNPDVVIVYYGINDGSSADIPDKYVRTLPQWLEHMLNFARHSELYNFFLRIYLSFKYPVGIENSYSLERVSPQEYKNNIREIDELAKSKGIKAIFVARPVWYNRAKKEVFTNGNYVVPSDVWQIDIYRSFKMKGNHADGLFFNNVRPNNFHITEKGHRIIAKDIFKDLLEKGYIEDVLEKTKL